MGGREGNGQDDEKEMDKMICRRAKDWHCWTSLCVHILCNERNFRRDSRSEMARVYVPVLEKYRHPREIDCHVKAARKRHRDIDASEVSETVPAVQHICR